MCQTSSGLLGLGRRPFVVKMLNNCPCGGVGFFFQGATATVVVSLTMAGAVAFAPATGHSGKGCWNIVGRDVGIGLWTMDVLQWIILVM